MNYDKISVREIAANDSEAWDELVRSSRQGIEYLLYDFLKMWTETDPTLYLTRLGCYSGRGQLVGGQAIIHRRVMGVRVQNNLSIFHTSTPILPDVIQNRGWMRYEVLAALASESRKHFPYLRAEFHPSLNDARPFLEQGWRVAPKYTHVWDISDPDALLTNMQHKRRQDVRSAQKNMHIHCESGDSILENFVRLYREDMKKFGWKPEKSWDDIFKKRVRWMEDRGCFRLYTCRTSDGQLLGMGTYILSHINQTAYGWLLAYDHSLNNREFTPAMYWLSAQDLASEFHYVDLGEGYRPSLYATKDSFGNSSVPYWIVATKSTKIWTRVYNKLKAGRQSISKIFS